jgi:hypothetical protein
MDDTSRPRWRPYSVLWLFVSVVVAGCGPSHHFARIDDCTGAGYRIVAVDGMAEKRLQGSVVTYVPVVLVEPGSHTFTLQNRDVQQDKLTITATVEADKGYRPVLGSDNTVGLVERERDE